MKKLTCPSCGGNLEVPDNFAVAHCMYCGGKILLSDESAKERVSLSRYIELLHVATEAANHDDMLRYANAILEIDQDDTNAWVQKAVATFWLTLPSKAHALSAAAPYLDRAAALQPDNESVQEVGESLARVQADWYIELGIQTAEQADSIYNAWKSSGFSDLKARAESTRAYFTAMGYLLAASTLIPSEMTYLNSIDVLARATSWVQWPDKIREKRDILSRLRQKTTALARLPEVRKELRETEQQLTKLQSKKGLFTGLQISDLQSRVRNLSGEILDLEHAAAYQPPEQK